jgi:hypothetical protein
MPHLMHEPTLRRSASDPGTVGPGGDLAWTHR